MSYYTILCNYVIILLYNIHKQKIHRTKYLYARFEINRPSARVFSELQDLRRMRATNVQGYAA